VKDSCEKIQHYGARKDATGTKNVDDDALSLKRIKDAIEEAQSDYIKANKKLSVFYDN
jgi:osomolarity two-component system phosphorelay intermediate protein YPD1